jgi:tetratricopeptide (TPR) repeat protein
LEELTRDGGNGWTTLAAAHYLRGEWQAALAVLRRAVASPSGGNGADRYLLCQTLGKLGRHEEARKWSNQFLAWMADRDAGEQLWPLAAERLPGWLARAPQPDSGEVRLGRARAFLFLNQPEMALKEATRAALLQPKDRRVWQTRCEIHLRLKKPDEALADCGKAVDLAPGDDDLRQLRGKLAAYCGRWAVAAHDFDKLTRATTADPETDWRPWYRHALALLAAGKEQEYRKASVNMLERFKDADAETAFFTVWTCALGPKALPDMAPAVALAERTAANHPQDARFLSAVAATYYRAGRLKECVERGSAALGARTNLHLSSPAYTHYFLALAYHRLGDRKEAGKWLEEALAETDRELRGIAGNMELERWNRRATLQLLRAEAMTLLGPPVTRPEK